MNEFPTPRNVDHLLDILSAFTDYEKMESFHNGKVRCELDGMHRFVESLDRPDRALPCVHIAGSKGKGSTALMTAALAQGAGLRCGLFSSPHLIRLEERIAIDGDPVSADLLLRAADRALDPLRRERALRPTFFEFITATAMIVFAECGVDLAVYEVGLGGRLDATNVVEPVVSVITDIELEHTRRLGNTRTAIAREKAGIIKRNVPVVTMLDGADPARPVIEGLAKHRAAPFNAPGAGLELLREGEEFRVRFRDRITAPFSPPPPAILQARNSALAIGAMSVVGESFGARVPALPDATLLSGLVLPGRFETLSSEPRVIVDGAHSPRSLEAVMAEARRTTRTQNGAGRFVAVFGLARDKDLEACVKAIVPFADEIVFVRYDSPRSRDPVHLQAAAGGRGLLAESVAAGLSLAQESARPGGTVLVTGSFYAAGEARALLSSS